MFTGGGKSHLCALKQVSLSFVSLRIGQTVAVAYRLPLVLAGIHVSILKDRDDLVYELNDVVRRPRRLQSVAIDRTVFPKVYHFACYLLRSAEQKPMMPL